METPKMILVVAVAALFFASCDKVVGEGPTVTQDRDINAFSAIDISVPADIYYSADTEYKMQIEGQQNIIDLVESDVNSGTLKIKFNRNNINIKSKKLRITITSPNVTSLHMSGSANLYITAGFEPENFDLSMSGSCHATIDSIATNTFHASISGSGNIVAKNGTVQKIDVEISGSGNIDMLGLIAKNAVTHSSGSGNVKVNVTDNLDAHISGSGEVHYKGSPVVTSEISGSGKVSRIE